MKSPQPEQKQPSRSARSPASSGHGGSASENDLIMVGIGASAGGLHPLQALLEKMPEKTGMAFVVVMHIDPNRKSGLPDVLRSHTKMPVIQVTEKTPVEPNHVYVIPPNKRLLATDDALAVEDFDKPRGQRVPVDQLFRSLAEVHSERVFGIILSGSGTDGAVGMKEIKEKGGFLMAQDPDEAEFSSMPRAAIATGLVDLVLPADEIARHLQSFARVGATAVRAPEQLIMDSPDGLQEVLAYLRSRVGHDFSHYKPSTVQRRVGRRMQINQTRRLPEYLDLLRKDDHEPQALFKDLLIGVTTFFRDAAAWKALAKNVVPRLFEGKETGDAVRAWVSGCSSGEEAYTLAILLLEHAETLETQPGIQIFASDIDEDGLDLAREGLFPEGIETDIPKERLKRFFTHQGNHYRAKKELRESVIFAAHDLLRDPPFSRLDLVTCRNVLIYLERDMQDRVFEIFHYALHPHGYLFLGSSESLGGSKLFQTVDKTRRIFQAREYTGKTTHLPTLPLTTKTHLRPRKGAPQPPRNAPSEGELHRQMLEEYAPPSILVDEHYHVVHLSESAGRYLTPSGGTLSHDVTKLVRPQLRLGLRGALHPAFDREKRSVTRPVPVKFDGTSVAVSMIVRPSEKRHDSQRLALVLFLEDNEARIVTEEGGGTAEGDERVARLKGELHHAQEQLQSAVEEYDATHEELKASNEELQSMNEEYRSTTEELETSREELQSINEELQTVNNELKSKLEEVSRANDDLQNLMAATDIGTLFLDRELRIKRFTPRIHQLFNIVPTDIGRPIGHFTHAFAYDDLIPTAEKLLEDPAPREAEVQGKDERWYLMRLRPYRTAEDRIDGVVVTFVDITERRSAEEERRRSEETYRILLENVRDYAIFMMDTERRITAWNSGAQRIFGYSEQEVMGESADIIFIEDDRKAGVPEGEMKTAIEKGEASDERLHCCKDGSTFWATGVLAALFDREGNLRGYAKVLRDNTERKEAADRLRQRNETLEERVKERTEQVRVLASTLTMAEQEERRRISQILHDNLQQLLYSVQMKLTVISRDSKKPAQTGLKKKAEEACEIISDAIQTTRQLTVDLSPPVLKGEGLADALRWLVSLMEDVHELKVDLIAKDPFLIPNEDMRVLLFQIVRELLFNIVKHAETDRAKVELEGKDGHIVIQVWDNGTGFDVAAAAQKQPKVFGLFGVRERLNLFGGRMEIDSAPGKGSRIVITAPIDPGESIEKTNQARERESS